MIYFDSAATTLQKPESVSRAVSHAISHYASPGRGSHKPAWDAAETVFRCREAAAELFSFPRPERIALTGNATHALNIAIKSLVRPGAKVLISGYEHNAVTRPLVAIGNVEVRVARAPLFAPDQILEEFDRQMHGVSAVICNHVSNVFGYILPIEKIAALCRMRGIPLIVDASQSAGVVPIDMTALGAAFIAMPGHKGLYGPQGTGVLLCAEEPHPLMEGGTGSLSAMQEMPDFLPDRLEPGTHNVAGIAGLLEGINFVRRKSVESIFAHESELLRAFSQEVSKIPDVKAYLSENPADQAGVVSISVPGRDCEEFGQSLGARGACVRSGLHCAPLAHETAGTLEEGTVRVSFSAFNTHREVESFARVLRQLVSEKKQ